MLQAMKGVTKAMQSMNSQMKLPEIQKIMMEFEKQTEMMDMKEEMMNDVIGILVFVIKVQWGSKFFNIFTLQWGFKYQGNSNYRHI